MGVGALPSCQGGTLPLPSVRDPVVNSHLLRVSGSPSMPMQMGVGVARGLLPFPGPPNQDPSTFPWYVWGLLFVPLKLGVVL